MRGYAKQLLDSLRSALRVFTIFLQITWWWLTMWQGVRGQRCFQYKNTQILIESQLLWERPSAFFNKYLYFPGQDFSFENQTYLAIWERPRVFSEIRHPRPIIIKKTICNKPSHWGPTKTLQFGNGPIWGQGNQLK